jgi:hypothetical protein
MLRKINLTPFSFFSVSNKPANAVGSKKINKSDTFFLKGVLENNKKM